MQGLIGTNGCSGTSAVTLFGTVNNLIVIDTSQHGYLQCELTAFVALILKISWPHTLNIYSSVVSRREYQIQFM
jgi:hypothetical protein